ncbi:MAG: hypothetical protein JWM27_3462 [Gemmatimonadetes bacterium]|nr:hypothetical protein [Gemmatimonadota bacterium]
MLSLLLIQTAEGPKLGGIPVDGRAIFFYALTVLIVVLLWRARDKEPPTWRQPRPSSPDRPPRDGRTLDRR